jgi:hypothetical protein
MSALELKAYEVLKNKLGENEATTLIEYFESKAEEKFTEKKEVLATKEDVANVRADIIKWMFIFWIGQIAATFGFILLFLKK